MSQQNPNDKPDAKGLAYARQAPAVKIVRDVLAGTLHIRKLGKAYLPQFPKEPNDAYRDRLNAATLFNGTKRTIRGLTGMVFRKDPVLGDKVPKEVAADWEDIDLKGTHGDGFAADAFDEAQADGHVHIFVDMPRTDTRFRNRLEEERAGRRPYWALIRKMDVLRFRARRVNGAMVLSSFAHVERSVEPDGEFGEREVERIRQYDRGTLRTEGQEPRTAVVYRVWEKRETVQGEEWEPIQPAQELEGMDEIPLATSYTEPTGFMESEPPHLDLALQNIRLYQVASDNDNVAHIAKVPIPVFIGVPEDEVKILTIGAGFGICLENQEANALYLQADGSSLGEFRNEEAIIEKRMAILGLSMLMSESRAAETASSKRIDKAESDSALARWVRNHERALNEALRLQAKWRGIEAKREDNVVTLNRDFQNQEVTPQMVAALSTLVEKNQLTIETMWDLLIAGELLPDSFDPKKEREGLESSEGDVAALLAAAGRKFAEADAGGDSGGDEGGAAA